MGLASLGGLVSTGDSEGATGAASEGYIVGSRKVGYGVGDIASEGAVVASTAAEGASVGFSATGVSVGTTATEGLAVTSFTTVDGNSVGTP